MDFKCWFKFKVCLKFKICLSFVFHLKFHIKLQIELLHLTSFHSSSNWRQNPYYKSLKFKVYDLHSSSNSNLCLAPCVLGWVNLLLLVSLAGIFCAFESFVLLLLIFTSGGGGFVELWLIEQVMTSWWSSVGSLIFKGTSDKITSSSLIASKPL